MDDDEFTEITSARPDLLNQPIYSPPPQPGMSVLSASMPPGPRQMPVKDPRELALSLRPNSQVVVFTSHDQTRRFTYTYAAISIRGKWYITGKGEWYGKNVFPHDEFINEVLCANEVTSIHVMRTHGTLYQE